MTDTQAMDGHQAKHVDHKSSIAQNEPHVPKIVIPVEFDQETEKKRRELKELEEKIRIRMSQIERAEHRLLSLQQQILGVMSPSEGNTQSPSSDISTAEVFRVDVTSTESLRLSTSTQFAPPQNSTSLSVSAPNMPAPSPKKPLLLSDNTVPNVSSTLSPTSAPASAPAPIGASASPSSNRILSVFGMRSTTDGVPPKSSSTTSIGFTILKSFFGSGNEERAMNFTIDASQIQICEKQETLCTTDYKVYLANVGGWGCNMKRLPLAVESNESRFFKRIKLLEALPAHPNIVRYYFHDIEEDTKSCRIFLEWFHTTLSDVIQQRKEAKRPFSPQEIEFVLMEVVKGMEFLHSYSILHRTISPSHIQVLLNSEGTICRVAIGNLDLAKVITVRVNAKSTAAHDPRFSAPEVLSAKTTGAYSFPSDIWSLGLVCYSLLALQKPWADLSSVEAVTSAILSGKRPILDAKMFGDEAHNEKYAPYVEIFNECTRKTPDDRPTVSIIKQALVTKASIAEHRRASQLNIGFTYQPKREASTFFEHFLVIGVPFGSKEPQNMPNTILYQYPSPETHPLPNQNVVVNFSMAQKRIPARLKRTNSMSLINGKLYAARDQFETSAAASIFAIMEGEELRYGICVYCEEPVDLVPTFISLTKAFEEAKKDSSKYETRRLSKNLSVLTVPPKRKTSQPSNLDSTPPSPTHHERTTAQAHQEGEKASHDASLLPDPASKRRRGHLRTASDGTALIASAAKKQAQEEANMHSAAPLPASLGSIKFASRCYMLFSKWPFFKLHFEVLWSILAQERSSRQAISEVKPEYKPSSTPGALDALSPPLTPEHSSGASSKSPGLTNLPSVLRYASDKKDSPPSSPKKEGNLAIQSKRTVTSASSLKIKSGTAQRKAKKADDDEPLDDSNSSNDSSGSGSGSKPSSARSSTPPPARHPEGTPALLTTIKEGKSQLSSSVLIRDDLSPRSENLDDSDGVSPRSVGSRSESPPPKTRTNGQENKTIETKPKSAIIGRRKLTVKSNSSDAIESPTLKRHLAKSTDHKEPPPEVDLSKLKAMPEDAEGEAAGSPRLVSDSPRHAPEGDSSTSGTLTSATTSAAAQAITSAINMVPQTPPRLKSSLSKGKLTTLKRSATIAREEAPQPPPEPEPTEDNNIFLKMLTSYYKVPMPLQKHQTTLSLASHSPILYTPGDVTESTAEWCFPCMFRTLSVKSLIKLFTSVLLEEKIVMFCEDTGILTACVTGLTAMLRPYAWQGTFLPIVPANMVAVVESPIPFVAGMPTRQKPLDNFDGVVADLHTGQLYGHVNTPRLPGSDRIYDAFSQYAEAIQVTPNPSNRCKSNAHDSEALTKLLGALALWHTYLLEQLAAVPSVGLDFKWNNVKEVELVIKALSFSERDFYREFLETQHFSIISERLNTVICQLRARKDHQKQVQKLENIFVGTDN